MKTYPKAPALLEWNQMTPQNQLIFDKSDSVRSRIKECKNLSHALNWKFKSIIHQRFFFLKKIGFTCV
jgi:hypothetical protein